MGRLVEAGAAAGEDVLVRREELLELGGGGGRERVGSGVVGGQAGLALVGQQVAPEDVAAGGDGHLELGVWRAGVRRRAAVPVVPKRRKEVLLDHPLPLQPHAHCQLHILVGRGCWSTWWMYTTPRLSRPGCSPPITPTPRAWRS